MDIEKSSGTNLNFENPIGCEGIKKRCVKDTSVNKLL